MIHPNSEALGLRQLSRYLDRLGQAEGYLILFERDDSVSWEQRLRWETQTVAEKRITLVGV